MINIITADDHAIIRHGLKQMISEEVNMKIVDEAENGLQIFELLEKKSYDILILDICMPDMGGMEVLNKLKNYENKPKVLMLSVLPDAHYAVRMIKMGASGYLNKIADIDKLVFAINKVASGGYYISQSLTKKLISMLKLKKDIIVNEKLNNWEFEILWMIISGKSVNEIADALMLSTAEVNKQYSNIFMKMNVDDVSGLLHHCIVNYLPVDFTYV